MVTDAAAPAVRAVMDSRTAAAIFGMARTTRVPSGSRDSSRVVVSPAAMETTRGFRTARISCNGANTTGMTCGLTARITTSLVPTSSSALGARRTPVRAASAEAESCALHTVVSPLCPEAIRPSTIAPAILPAPMKP